MDVFSFPRTILCGYECLRLVFVIGAFVLLQPEGSGVFSLAGVNCAGGDVSAYSAVLAAESGALPLLWPAFYGGKGGEHYHLYLLDFFGKRFYDKGAVFERRSPVFDTGCYLFSGDWGYTFGVAGHNYN